MVFIDRLLKDVQCDVVLADNLNVYDAVEQLIIRDTNASGLYVDRTVFILLGTIKGIYQSS